jgi:methylmalonyl-CoA mutase C-terminal domain/subunit
MRILIAKPGLDGHDQGAKVVVQALVEAGFEVIYTGLKQSPEAIARAAADEDVDAVGLSVLSGAHLPLLAKLSEEMKAAGVSHVPIVVGGNIPPPDRPKVLEAGAAAVFATGSRFDDIVAWFRERESGP